MVLRGSPTFRVIVLAATTLIAMGAFAGDLAKPVGIGSRIDFQLVGNHESVSLTVVGPYGDSWTDNYASGKNPYFRLDKVGAGEADGTYNWELRAAPQVSASVRKQLDAARKAGDDAAARKIMRANGLDQDLVQSGVFTVRNGMVVSSDETEADSNDATIGRKITSDAANRPNFTPVANDQVIPDDLIVQGSLCVGFDCVNGENFGFDTIRLKENNLRIKAEDTSVGTFPTTDWQLTFNDSASGGQSKFSVEDITGARVPFTVEASSTTNSVYIDSTGRVGFRTSTPVLDIHINTSNTPAIRLEQNNSGGFTAQTWDIGGNEANFFVRDVTGGSLLPFRIRPGAPTSTLDLSADGDVGIGTGSPDRRLHVLTTGAADNTVLEIETNGPSRMRFNNNSNAEVWNLGHQSPAGTGFVISDVGDGTTEVLVDVAGNMTIAGMLTQGSSREIKTDFDIVDPAAALEGVRNLSILTWKYKNDDAKHLGPVAEEFYAAFGLGADDKHIAPSDQAGLALAAIQGLANQVQEKNKQIEDLEARLAQLESLIKSQQ